MERLPYIDEHAIPIPADRAATWDGRAAGHVPRPGREINDPATVPFGFVLDEADATGAVRAEGPALVRELSTGVHPAPTYPTDRTRLAAQTWAAFPGIKGRIYRALVIGSGGHRVGGPQDAQSNRTPAGRQTGVDHVHPVESQRT